MERGIANAKSRTAIVLAEGGLVLYHRLPTLGARGHEKVTLEGGGGGGVILKKISCQRLSEEKNCMQYKRNRKKILALL